MLFFEKIKSQKINLWNNIISFVFGIIILIVTWFFLFFFIKGIVEMLLVPWDTIQVQFRPEIGTWERSLNDFFEAGIGAVLPSIIFIIGSLVMFIFRFKKEKEKDQLFYLFSFLNFLFFLFLILLGYIGNYITSLWLSDELFLVAGYHKTWFSIAMVFTAYIALFLAQAKISIKKDKI